MNHLFVRGTVLLLLSGFCACSKSEESTSSHFFRIYVENGVTIAKTTGGPKYGVELFEYVEVLRLKQDESVEESLLGYPTFYLMDKDGAFYVYDYRPPRIVCYDSGGKYSHTIGREGEGPGEFRSLELPEIKGDTLILFDYRLRRTSRFRTDGTLIDILTTSRQKTGPALRYSLSGLLEDEFGRRFLLWDGFTRDEIFNCTSSSITVFDPDGTEVCSIETPFIKYMFDITSRGITAGANIPFAGKPVIKLLDDGRILRSTGETPEIELFSIDGDLTGRIILELPQERSDSGAQEIRNYYRERAESTPSEHSRNLSLAMAEDLYVPEFKAYWSDVEIDDYGFIWLKHTERLYGSSSEVAALRILSPEGEYLGETEWMCTEGRVSHGHLLTIQENEETGAQDLIVYKIRPAVRGLKYP